MARGTATYQQLTGTLANYKACYQTISNVITSALPRTTDTGQVNWGTIATEAGTVRDYEVVAFGGALQATSPIYIRFDYQGTTTGGVYITVGTTTDGAGNLGGLSIAKHQFQNHSLSTSTQHSVWAASDGTSYLTFLYALDVAASGGDGVGMVVVERTRDVDGTANGTGFHVWRWQCDSAVNTNYFGGWSKTFGAASQPAAIDWNLNVLVPDMFNTNSAAAAGGVFYSFPVYTYTPPVAVRGASKALMFAYTPDFPRGVAAPITHYGENMNFIPLADSVRNSFYPFSAATGGAFKYLSPMIRWD